MTMLTKPEDFIERTKINLTLYLKKRYQEQNEKKDGAEYELEVTQILNSFLGIIVVPYEEEKTSSWKTLIPNDLQQKMTLLPPHKQPATLGELCEELRHTVAHGNFLPSIVSDKPTPIREVTFRNYRTDTTILKFEMVLSIEDMLTIFNMVCSELGFSAIPMSLLTP